MGLVISKITSFGKKSQQISTDKLNQRKSTILLQKLKFFSRPIQLYTCKRKKNMKKRKSLDSGGKSLLYGVCIQNKIKSLKAGFLLFG